MSRPAARGGTSSSRSQETSARSCAGPSRSPGLQQLGRTERRRKQGRIRDTGAAPDISEPEIQFADYALWEKELLASDALDEARSYWKRLLKDATGTEVPPDHLPPGRRKAGSRLAHFRPSLDLGLVGVVDPRG